MASGNISGNQNSNNQSFDREIGNYQIINEEISEPNERVHLKNSRVDPGNSSRNEDIAICILEPQRRLPIPAPDIHEEDEEISDRGYESERYKFDPRTEWWFMHPLIPKNWRSIIVLITMFFCGIGMLYGAVRKLIEGDIGWFISYFVFGCMLITSSLVMVFRIYGAVKMWIGFSFSEIPNLRE